MQISKVFVSFCSALFLLSVYSSTGKAQTEFDRDFAPTPAWIKPSEAPFRKAICLNGRWDFQPVAVPADWKRNTGGASGRAPELSEPTPSDWEKTPIKIPSPWNVNTWGGGRDAGTKAHNLYWPDSVYFPSYPESWDKVEMGWLRKTFHVPTDWNLNEKRLVVHFEAVAGDCVVLVNGKKAGEHFDKYLPFELDVTELVKPDTENELLVGVRSHTLFDKQSEKYSKMRATYPPGSETHRLVGITDDVYLLARPRVYISDVFVKPTVSKDMLEIDIALKNSLDFPIEASVDGDVFTWINQAKNDLPEAPEPKESLGTKEFSLKRTESVAIPAGETATLTISEKIDGRLKFWTPDEPNLYGLVLYVHSLGGVIVGDDPLIVSGGTVKNLFKCDSKQTRFGWREFRIDGKELLLNGKKIQLFGDLLHPFGAYVNSRRFVWAWYTMIKDMGGNAVRPHAQIHPRMYLELADEMGIVVLDENSIFGSSIMLNFDDSEIWKRYEDHAAGMVLRDRNHPSVVGWSIGNELFAVFHLNNVSPEDTKTYYDKIVELGKLCNKLDPTRPWISCDGDEDLDGRISVWSKHFGHGNSLDRLPELDKPLMVGESGGTYYATPRQLSAFNGDRAYESYAGRNEALGIDVYENIVNMAKPRLAFYSASETAWFGIEHLPLGYTDRTRRPTLDDGVFFTKSFEEGKPGMQIERIPPFVTTFNPGWDENLPLYKPLEMFRAQQAAILGKPYKKKTVAETEPKPEQKPPVETIASVGYFGFSPCNLEKKLRSLGIPFIEIPSGEIRIPDKTPFLVIEADPIESISKTKSQVVAHWTKQDIEKTCSDGGTVIVFAQNPKTDLSELLGMDIEITERKATMLVPNREHDWSSRFTLPDLYFAEDGDARFIQKAGIDGKDIEKFETILEGSDTDWSLFNRVAEHSKCGALLMYEQLEKPSGKALIAKKHGNGILAVCSLDYTIDTKSTRKFWRSLFQQMGVKLNEESALLLPAIDEEENSLVNAVVLGRLNDEQSNKAIAEALKNPPRSGDQSDGKDWQAFKSPSKDRIVFNWMRQDGPKKDFDVLLSFWIKSPRALDDLLADGPDAPRFGLMAYSADENVLYLNGKKTKIERTESVDYRTLSHWENLPLKKDWNHFLMRVSSKNLETDKPGTIAVRIRSNNPAFLNELESAAELPPEVDKTDEE